MDANGYNDTMPMPQYRHCWKQILVTVSVMLISVSIILLCNVQNNRLLQNPWQCPVGFMFPYEVCVCLSGLVVRMLDFQLNIVG